MPNVMPTAQPASLTILTGASRGLGLAMARQLLQPGQTLLTMARQPHAGLVAEVQRAGATLEQWAIDLGEPQQAAQRLQDWLRSQPAGAFGVATLINNAGVIPPIAPLRRSQPAAMAQALRVGLEAPMLLSAAFLAATQGWAGQRKILNISSGLGRRPMASQAPYCAAKAGLDHFTRCLALEEAATPQGAQVCALAPGVIDTDMQTHLRSAAAQDFSDLPRFAALKSQGQLSSAEDTARRILAYLQRPDFGQQPIADIREVAEDGAG